jgi:hypothetical protein
MSKDGRWWQANMIFLSSLSNVITAGFKSPFNLQTLFLIRVYTSHDRYKKYISKITKFSSNHTRPSLLITVMQDLAVSHLIKTNE